MFDDTFPEPQRFATPGQYVPSLAGGGKMSKSVEGSFITLHDDLETIKRRLAAAPTDSGKAGGEVPKQGGVANLFTLLELFGQYDMYKKFAQDYKEKKIRYTELKEVVANAIYTELKPLQEKRKEFEQNPKLVDAILEQGRAQCSKIAEETMQEVRKKMGLQ